MELDNFNLSINDLDLSSKLDIKKAQTTKKENQVRWSSCPRFS